MGHEAARPARSSRAVQFDRHQGAGAANLGAFAPLGSHHGPRGRHSQRHHTMRNHNAAAVEALCGRTPVKGDLELLANDPTVDFPCFGSALELSDSRRVGCATACGLAACDVQRRQAPRANRRLSRPGLRAAASHAQPGRTRFSRQRDRAPLRGSHWRNSKVASRFCRRSTRR